MYVLFDPIVIEWILLPQLTQEEYLVLYVVVLYCMVHEPSFGDLIDYVPINTADLALAVLVELHLFELFSHRRKGVDD